MLGGGFPEKERCRRSGGRAASRGQLITAATAPAQPIQDFEPGTRSRRLGGHGHGRGGCDGPQVASVLGDQEPVRGTR
jgi:hypothetical protein